MNKYDNPWLGLRAYEEQDNYKFKGREEDAANMVALLQQNDYVVCYAASGDGKSSLINAGVCPEIRKLGMFPIKISFNTDDEDLLDKTDIDFDKIILEKISSRIEEYRERFIEKYELSEEDYIIHFEKTAGFQEIEVPDSLWWKLRTETIQIPYGEFDYIPVLIFDQFEEVLRAPWKTQFFKWLEELSRDICPDRIVASTGLKHDNLPNRKMFKMLFSLRYEYVGELDYWCSQRNYIPQLMRNRYFLKPLTRAQAIAIINSQGEKDDANSIRLKNDSEKIVDEIIMNLDNNQSEEDEVSAIMLSLSCYLNYNKPLNISDDFDTLLFTFYLRQMDLVGISDEDRIVLEEALISPRGTRIRIPTSDYRLQQIHINDYIDCDYSLFDTGLFKKEETGRTFNGHNEYYVEFTHDLLAESVHKNKKNSLIPIKRKKTISYTLILIGLLALAAFSYLLNNPVSISQIDSKTIDNNPIRISKQNVPSIENFDYKSATSIKLDGRGLRSDEINCYNNVLIWRDVNNNNCIRYAHNAQRLTFAYSTLPSELKFGHNTEEVYLLSTNKEIIDSVSFVNCTNKNTIVYVPHGDFQRISSNKAFSNVCVKELGIALTMIREIQFKIHMSRIDFTINNKAISIHSWLLYIFICVFSTLIIIGPKLSLLKNERLMAFTSYCIVSFSLLIFSTMQFSLWIDKLFLSNTTTYTIRIIGAIIFVIVISYFFICLVYKIEFPTKKYKNKEKQLDKEKYDTPFCYIVYNSKKHKQFAISLKQLLLLMGFSDSNFEVLGIDEMMNKYYYNKIIFLLSKDDLIDTERNKKYFSYLSDKSNLHPVFVETDHLDEASIPKQLKPIITTKIDGTLDAFQSVFYDPVYGSFESILQLTRDLLQKNTKAMKKRTRLFTIATICYIASLPLVGLLVTNGVVKVFLSIVLLTLYGIYYLAYNKHRKKI